MRVLHRNYTAAGSIPAREPIVACWLGLINRNFHLQNVKTVQQLVVSSEIQNPDVSKIVLDQLKHFAVFF